MAVSFRIKWFCVQFCCESDESRRDASHQFHSSRIAMNDAGRCSLKVTLLLPSLRAGECDRLVNTIADVTHGMNQWRIANFLAQPSDENLD